MKLQRLKYFRISRIRLWGKYRLLKRVHSRIVIDLLFKNVKKRISIENRINPDVFNKAFNEAQLRYLSKDRLGEGFYRNELSKIQK